MKCLLNAFLHLILILKYPIEGRSTKLTYDVTIFHDVISCELISDDVHDDVSLHFYVENLYRARVGDTSLLRGNLHYQIIV